MLPLTINDNKTVMVLWHQAMSTLNVALQRSAIVQTVHHTFVPKKWNKLIPPAIKNAQKKETFQRVLYLWTFQVPSKKRMSYKMSKMMLGLV